MSPRPKGRLIKSNLKERIIETAWNQIGLEGAAALSLRAIARELGIAAPSIYNYFPDRDALVTELIIQAYDSLGVDQLDALTQNADLPLRQKFVAIGRAYRKWAIRYPQRYLLIFGSPIPGYVVPGEVVSPVAMKSLCALTEVIKLAIETGDLNTETYLNSIQKLPTDLITPEKLLQINSKATLIIAILVWTRVHGLVLTEVSSNFPPEIPDGETLFEIELNLAIEQFMK